MDTAIQQSFINPAINREKGDFIQFSGLRKSFKEGGQMRVPCKNLDPKHSLEKPPVRCKYFSDLVWA